MIEQRSISLPSVAGFSLIVPPERRCRVNCLTFAGAALTPGEAVTVHFSQGNVEYAAAVTGPAISGNEQVTFGLGLSQSAPHLTDTVVATGVANYQVQDAITGGLPDIWFDRDTAISMTTPTGFTDAQGSMMFEEDTLFVR
jgi:hypothetical protein